jgi:hypothetical protein
MYTMDEWSKMFRQATERSWFEPCKKVWKSFEPVMQLMLLLGICFIQFSLTFLNVVKKVRLFCLTWCCSISYIFRKSYAIDIYATRFLYRTTVKVLQRWNNFHSQCCRNKNVYAQGQYTSRHHQRDEISRSLFPCFGIYEHYSIWPSFAALAPRSFQLIQVVSRV